jgi:hypothetical protein
MLTVAARLHTDSHSFHLHMRENVRKLTAIDVYNTHAYTKTIV